MVNTASLSPAHALDIDLTTPVRPVTPTPIEPGSTANPRGVAITADSRSFFLGGQPWIPIAGEFHHARYPRAEWRDALLKMKAGGITIVSTYVFWIYHEEEKGTFDWSGDRDLRAFLQLCGELGLKAFVRMGPWCHGEVRNGGFPDWVQDSHTKLRTVDPAFLALVKPFFEQTAAQMKGLLWKDGGPVICVQMDNECNNPAYLLALKRMARDAGVDVPLYTMTGWNKVELPKAGLLPLFGAYADGFWGGSLETYRKSFVFSEIRDDGDLGARMQNARPERNEHLASFPFACAEIGPGMMSSYKKRVKINPDDVGAMALVKLGDGNNLPGYYMYQGGINPDGKTPFLQEAKPNEMPVKDYDFQTALGACGQVRRQYHLLREQHLFLEDFGAALARMPAYFPDQKPKDLKDFDTLRWSVRAEGERGFLFFNNHQPAVPLPPHGEVQFALKTAAGVQLVPRMPIAIPSGSYGIWPVNLDCDGVPLRYATAQPLCRVADENGDATYFFTALPGVRAELSLEGEVIPVSSPGPAAVASVNNAQGRAIRFVVLTPEQGLALWKAPFAGRMRAVLSPSTVLADGPDLHLQTPASDETTFAIFPGLPTVRAGGQTLGSRSEGVFSRFSVPTAKPPTISASASPEPPAGAPGASLKATDEAAWPNAAVFTVAIPADAAERKVILDFHYLGDAARLYLGDRLYLDHFFNGDPLSLALWRIPSAKWPFLRLKVLPMPDDLAGRLPAQTRRLVEQAKTNGTLGKVTVTATLENEISIAPPLN